MNVLPAVDIAELISESLACEALSHHADAPVKYWLLSHAGCQVEELFFCEPCYRRKRTTIEFKMEWYGCVICLTCGALYDSFCPGFYRQVVYLG